MKNGKYQIFNLYILYINNGKQNFALQIQVINDKYKYDRDKDCIGAGSYGEIYKAQDLKQRQIVALKLIRKNIQESKQEAELMESLNCPYIVHGIEHFTIEQQGFKLLVIVMPFYPLQDLQRFVRKYYDDNFNNIPIELIRKWCIQSLQAIQYLHQQQIIHRDIKTINFFLDKDLNLVLGDLGCSTKKNVANTFIGTVETLAPEIIKDSVSYNNKVDIFSLGCVWFELLTGKKPFYNPDFDFNQIQVFKKILNNNYQKDVTPRDTQLFQMAIKMLTTSPDVRPSADQAIQQLSNVIDQINNQQDISIQQNILQDIQQNINQQNQILNQLNAKEFKDITNEFAKRFQDCNREVDTISQDPLIFLQNEYNDISAQFPPLYINQARVQAIKELYFN